MAAIRVRTPILKSRSPYQPMAVDYFLTTKKDKVNFRPIYQRDIRWTQENFCDLIGTVMFSGLIPGIILYMLQEGDEKESGEALLPHREIQEYECIDGQHRFFGLINFFYGKLVELPDKKSFMISWDYKDEAGHITHVFYSKTDDTEEWIAGHPKEKFAYMTPEEKRHFNTYLVDIREITDPLTLQQRREIFTSLQKGVQVRNSDLYKNFTDIQVVNFLQDEERLEKPFVELLQKRITMKPSRYWLHWLIRLFLLSRSVIKGDTAAKIAEVFVKTDSEITGLIKKNSKTLLVTEDEKTNFMLLYNDFAEFLSSLPAKIHFTPTHFYALFIHLSCSEDSNERKKIIESNLFDWTTIGVGKREKKLWENRGDTTPEERMEYFSTVLSEITRIKVPLSPKSERTKVPKVVRDRAWRRQFGHEEEGVCPCCKKIEITTKSFHLGHIQAVACGGEDTIDNLMPICSKCNLRMGTMNLNEYKEHLQGE